jgi:hypothetical protein
MGGMMSNQVFFTIVVFSVMTLFTSDAFAVNCDRKPDHPQCDDGGTGEPPVESDPTIAFIDLDGQATSLYLMNEDGGAPFVLLKGEKNRGRNPGVSFERPTWDPTGHHLAYLGKPGTGLFRVPIDGSSPPVRINDGYGINRIAWRPQGDWIAFTRSEDFFVDGSNKGDFDVLLVQPSDGCCVHNLTINFPVLIPSSQGGGSAVEVEPSWSPDGERLLFSRWFDFDDGPWNALVICDPFDASGAPQPCDQDAALWHEAEKIESPQWHPNHELIAYIEGDRLDLFIESVDRQTCYHLHSVRSNINRDPDCTRISVGDFYFDGNFDWSSDGTGIISQGNFDSLGNSGIHAINGILACDGSLDDNIQILPLRTVDDPFNYAREPASRRGVCQVGP